LLVILFGPTLHLGRSGTDKSYVATGGVAQKQGQGFPVLER